MCENLQDSFQSTLLPKRPETKVCIMCGLSRKLFRFPLTCDHSICQYCLILLAPSIKNSEPRKLICANKKCKAETKPNSIKSFKEKKEIPSSPIQHNKENTNVNESNTPTIKINANTNSTKPNLLEVSENLVQFTEIKLEKKSSKENPVNLAFSKPKTTSCSCILI